MRNSASHLSRPQFRTKQYIANLKHSLEAPKTVLYPSQIWFSLVHPTLRTRGSLKAHENGPRKCAESSINSAVHCPTVLKFGIGCCVRTTGGTGSLKWQCIATFHLYYFSACGMKYDDSACDVRQMAFFSKNVGRHRHTLLRHSALTSLHRERGKHGVPRIPFGSTNHTRTYIL